MNYNPRQCPSDCKAEMSLKEQSEVGKQILEQI
jgi:hypothetical protein